MAFDCSTSLLSSASILPDKFRLEHVLANLLSNAIKFSSNGSFIMVHISVDAVRQPHHWQLESVQGDTTTGVPDGASAGAEANAEAASSHNPSRRRDEVLSAGDIASGLGFGSFLGSWFGAEQPSDRRSQQGDAFQAPAAAAAAAERPVLSEQESMKFIPVRIAVSDKGMGIPLAAQARLFEVFSQVGQTLTH